MKIKHAAIILIIVLCSFFDINAQQKAVTIVPVADLVGQSIGKEKYSKIALFTHPVQFCPRMHQLLYNEVVTIVEEKGEEVCILLDSVFYEVAGNPNPQNTYWTLKKNIVPLETIKKSGIPLAAIPNPIDFNNCKSLYDQSVVSLALPFHDSTTNRTYSAGTRFVKAPSQSSKDKISVFALDHTSTKSLVINLPRSLCIVTDRNKTEKERKAAFLRLVTTWAHQLNGFIPYVWGGCSFTALAHGNHFASNQIGQTHFYQPSVSLKHPYTGLDCAGLITRAAQLCGIPYFYKNTATLTNHLKEITYIRDVQDGDLIWFPGHVMIISSCKPAKIIEARAYGQGYGKIHELPLQNVFKGIDSLEKLFTHLIEKKSLFRLASDGSIAHSVTKFKIVRF